MNGPRKTVNDLELATFGGSTRTTRDDSVATSVMCLQRGLKSRSMLGLPAPKICLETNELSLFSTPGVNERQCQARSLRASCSGSGGTYSIRLATKANNPGAPQPIVGSTAAPCCSAPFPAGESLRDIESRTTNPCSAGSDCPGKTRKASRSSSASSLYLISESGDFNLADWGRCNSTEPVLFAPGPLSSV